MSQLNRIIYHPYFLYGLGVLLAVGLSLQLYFAPKKDFGTGKEIYTKYNNYQIFTNSFAHLQEQDQLYTLYPNEQWDLYKYTPTFSLFMGLFHLMPDSLGLILWNSLNILLLIWGLLKLPLQNKRMHLWIFGFLLIELITSTQNTQSNALITGLVLLGYGFLNEKRFNLSIFLISFAVFIKPFALFAFLPFLFYSNWYQHFVRILLINIVLLFLPLILVSPEYLLEQYAHWIDLLLMDHGDKVGYSVMGWLQTWFGLELNKILLLGIGVFTLVLPLLRIRYYQSKYFQLNYLALILIWMVIFNHMAESPTFVIAVTGVALWFFLSEKSIVDYILLGLVIVFTILIATDLFPKGLRESIMEPYAIKGVPCILVYGKILIDLMRYESEKVFATR